MRMSRSRCSVAGVTARNVAAVSGRLRRSGSRGSSAQAERAIRESSGVDGSRLVVRRIRKSNAAVVKFKRVF